MLDTINLEEIKHLFDTVEVAGITSNPSIVKKEGNIDFYHQMTSIQEIVGQETMIHVQVVSETFEEMVKEAELIQKNLGKSVYIKVPVTTEGLKAMKYLKKQGFNITATAVYSLFQGVLALNVQADYIAPYYNRMADLGINSKEVIEGLAELIDKNSSQTKILAASFKNSQQVNEALISGAHSVTLAPDLIKNNLDTAMVKKAVTDFKNDWEHEF